MNYLFLNKMVGGARPIGSRQRPALASLCALSLVGGCNPAALETNLEAMNQVAEVRGTVSARDWNESPLVVGVLKVAEVDGSPDQPFARRELTDPGDFVFYLPPGRYRIAAWEDTNQNLEWDEAEGERAGGYDGLRAVELRAGERRGRVDIRSRLGPSARRQTSRRWTWRGWVYRSAPSPR